MAKENPFRFSTKRTDNTTDFVLYEYRVYNPSLGRWPSRDPIGEEEALNLYGFVGSQPVDWVDTDGRSIRRGDDGPPGPTPKPKKPAVNPCDGYKKFIPTPKCMCNCKLIPDPYPADAEKVCNGFMEQYDWSDKAQCVARCLVAVEGATYRNKWCSVRATIRLSAHVACYASCGFYPWKGLPPGGVGVGAGDLLWTLAKCHDPWNEAK